MVSEAEAKDKLHVNPTWKNVDPTNKNSPWVPIDFGATGKTLTKPWDLGAQRDFFTKSAFGALPGVGSLFTGLGGGGDKNHVADKLAAYTTNAALPAFSGGDIMQSPTGETPLTELPQYGGAGGSNQAAQFYAGQDFRQMFGRNPTASELTQLAPAYMSDDPNIANQVQGRSLLAQYFQSLSNTPERQAAQKQKEYEAKAPQYYDEINQQYQQALGRDATDSEKKHFGALRASGNVDSYTVGEFLAALPEAVKKQDESFQQNLTGKLQSQDQQYYQENILPAIQQSFAKDGRSFDSSAYAAMLAKAAQQQNTNRDSFLSNLSASQYAGSQGLAQSAYGNAYNNYNNLQNYSMLRSNQLQDAFTGRSNDLQDYEMQKQAYDQYLQRYGKRNSVGMGALQGGMSGAGTGAMVGGPWGALIGGVGGAALGGYGASQNGY